MNIIHDSGYFGVYPFYYTSEPRLYGPTLGLMARGLSNLELDAEGIRQFFNDAPDGRRTCFKNIRKVPANHLLYLNENGWRLEEKPLPPVPDSDSDLITLLKEALKKSLAPYKRIGLALSGGLDSALVLALVRELGIDAQAYTLATGLPDYCELDETRRTAAFFNTPLKVVHTMAGQLISSLPDAVRAAEVPMYNLHPVSKLILARAMAADGIECMLTGDGADQAFSGSPAQNYLPIVGAMVRFAGLALCSPFFDEGVTGFALAHGDKNKTALRRAARSWVPEGLENRNKTPRLAPPIQLDAMWPEQLIRSLSKQLGIEINRRCNRNHTLWVTLALLVTQLERETQWQG